MSGRTFSFIFVCQGGELELKAMLLAASLREHVRCEHELVAAIPDVADQWPQPQADTLQLLEQLGVRTVSIRNPIGAHYPIGNKLSCLSIATRASKRVFLDTDMVMLSPFADSACFDAPFTARLAVRLPADDGVEQLRLAFAAVGLVLPEKRVPTIFGELVPPYFNAGNITVDAALPFGETWVECCRAIEGDPRVTCKRPWLDQLGLAAAVCKLGLDYAILDDRYNWRRVEPLHGRPLPVLLHYGAPNLLAEDERVRTAVVRWADRHAQIQQAIMRHASWQGLFASCMAAR